MHHVCRECPSARGATALISGVSVFVNSYGVHDFASPALDTTAKNAAAVLFPAIAAVTGQRFRRDVTPRHSAPTS